MNTVIPVSSVIASIGTASPANKFKQDEVLEFMKSTYGDDQARRKLSVVSRQSGIEYRNSVVPDFSLSCTDPELFADHTTPDVNQRMDIYKKNVLPLSIEAIEKAFNNIASVITVKDITHIITVSCTGLFSPGLSTLIIEHYHLSDITFHTAINFMGCNASFPALRLADLIVKDNMRAVVLVLCVELCTIHYRPKDNNDSILANTIFADGAAAMLITSADRMSGTSLNRFYKIRAFNTLTLNEGKSLMAWDLNPVNFEMVLSAEIPHFIAQNLKYIGEILKAEFQLSDFDHIKWAIHPGGRKILDAFISEMHLNKEDLVESYTILANYGNMSSVTIIFILKEILENLTISGDIIEMGFGPGITIESALLSI